MAFTADVELVAVERRRLRFKIDCRDEAELIGAGFHERAIVDIRRLDARLQIKRSKPTAIG
jgi:fluoroacetyl-CoA thioesterase